ncbi:hypothetical protein [Noviherbaspirillum sp. ST9]|uniref:hypothetical protein n=1 Tax=Noviherbaspirillum sp. ST9 TaxID=3401606 RepID=UPI003B586A06
MASIGPLILIKRDSPDSPPRYSDMYPPATLTVLDAQGRTGTTTLKFPVIHLTCPDNPLLIASPASANARETEVLAFNVDGGSGTFTAVSRDSNIATVLGQTSTGFTVQAKSVGSVLITVSSSDGQNSNIVFRVLPLQ